MEYEFIEFEEHNNHSNNQLSNNEVLNYSNNSFKIEKINCFKLDIPQFQEWKMNLLEISTTLDKMFLCFGNKVFLLPLQAFKEFGEKFHTRNSKKTEILCCEAIINQIKLIQNDHKEEFILVVDMKGNLYTKQLGEKEKKFNCKENMSIDNSCWSLDGKYPFAVIGGNHFKVKVVNIETSDIQTIIAHNHNVPSVNISQCGMFLTTSSIDKYVLLFYHFSQE